MKQNHPNSFLWVRDDWLLIRLFLSSDRLLRIRIGFVVLKERHQRWNWLDKRRCSPMSEVFLPAATKLGQGNVFTGVCDSVHRGGEGVCLSACWDATPREQTPQEQTPLPISPPPTGSRHLPWSRPPWEEIPPRSRHPPPPEADASIRSMSGRYASYWNAFLLWFGSSN